MWYDPVLKAFGRGYFRQAQDKETANANYYDIFKGIMDVEYGGFKENWEF